MKFNCAMMLCIWNIIALIGLFDVFADEKLFVPKHYVIHLTTSTWRQSQTTCKENGGNLGTISDFSTIPDIFIGHENFLNTEYLFWIGLHKQNVSQSYEWENGDNITWFNWRPGIIDNQGPQCVAVSSDIPYLWITMDCQERLPFLCQYNEGECRFVEFANMSIVSHNYMYLYEKSEEQCKNVCIIQLGTRCRSFDFYSADGRCEFNSGDRWTLAKYYRLKEGWVYFHWTCNIGEVANATISPSPTLGCLETSNIFVTHNIYASHVITISRDVQVSRDVPVTRAVILTSTYIDTTTVTVTETSTRVIFASPTFILPSASTVDPIEELKEIGEVAVERKKTLKKISVNDKRPSAKYVGYVAIIFLSVVFGAIVLFDLLTLCRYLKCFKNKDEDESTTRTNTGILKKAFDWRRIRHRKQCNIEEEEIKNNLRQRCVKQANDSTAGAHVEEDPTTSCDAVFENKTGRRSNMIWRPFILNMGDSGIGGSEASSSPDHTDSFSDIFHFQYFPNEFDNIITETQSIHDKEDETIESPSITTNF